MKSILLIVNPTDTEMGSGFQFDTIKEAQEYATAMSTGHEFYIFSQYGKGSSVVQWQYATDIATNLRENKMSEAVKRKMHTGRSGEWTDVEVQALVRARQNGMLIREIADTLHRSYNSCYSKLQSLGIKAT